jgi:hypothetical protein
MVNYLFYVFFCILSVAPAKSAALIALKSAALIALSSDSKLSSLQSSATSACNSFIELLSDCI